LAKSYGYFCKAKNIKTSSSRIIALWAFVDASVEVRLSLGDARLSPSDWKSGENLWLVDLIAPFGGQDSMFGEIKANVFPDRPLKVLVVKENTLSV
jgi:cytolysin-activating lysine-acyltransferase